MSESVAMTIAHCNCCRCEASMGKQRTTEINLSLLHQHGQFVDDVGVTRVVAHVEGYDVAGRRVLDLCDACYLPLLGTAFDIPRRRGQR